jgi:hypothetical protein
LPKQEDESSTIWTERSQPSSSVALLFSLFSCARVMSSPLSSEESEEQAEHRFP